MTDYSDLFAKISDFKAKIEKNSISPHYLGCILEELLLQVRDLGLLIKLLDDSSQEILDKAKLSVEVSGLPAVINPASFKIKALVHTFLSNVEISDQIKDSDITWTRYSEDKSGVQRKPSDEAWNALHANTGAEITLTRADLDAEFELPPVCVFTVTVSKEIAGLLKVAKAPAKLLWQADF